jgi:L-threonylcarbamoyladenylate synthase
MGSGILVRDELFKIIHWTRLDAGERTAAIERIAEQIIANQVMLLPSETRYALVARADSLDALDQLLALKGRPKQQPVSVFVESKEMISDIAFETECSRALSARFLPGPLTLVIEARKQFPSPIVMNGTIGVRISSDPVIQAVLKRVKFPLTATSANRSGMIECTTVDEILAQIGTTTLSAIDDGPREGQTSTVVDARTEKTVILREGAIRREEIEHVINSSVK